MALDQSALTELLEALKAGDDLDFMRRAMEVVPQLLIELEATEKIGAGRYERSEGRTTHRNGSRSRLLSTKAGDVNLQIPKLRQGSFFPSLLEPRRRIDKALWAVVMEAYVHGVSTRKVDDLCESARQRPQRGPQRLSQREPQRPEVWARDLQLGLWLSQELIPLWWRPLSMKRATRSFWPSSFPSDYRRVPTSDCTWSW